FGGVFGAGLKLGNDSLKDKYRPRTRKPLEGVDSKPDQAAEEIVPVPPRGLCQSVKENLVNLSKSALLPFVEETTGQVGGDPGDTRKSKVESLIKPECSSSIGCLIKKPYCCITEIAV